MRRKKVVEKQKLIDGSVDTHLRVSVDKKNEQYELDFSLKGQLKVDQDLAKLFIKNKQIQMLNKLG